MWNPGTEYDDKARALNFSFFNLHETICKVKTF